MKDTLDIATKWCSDNSIIAAGLILLVGALILSAIYQTAWGEWKSRKRKG